MAQTLRALSSAAQISNRQRLAEGNACFGSRAAVKMACPPRTVCPQCGRAVAAQRIGEECHLRSLVDDQSRYLGSFVVLLVSASVKSAPRRSAPAKLAFRKVASLKSALKNDASIKEDVSNLEPLNVEAEKSD